MAIEEKKFSYTLRPISLDDEEGREVAAALGRASHSFTSSETALISLMSSLMVNQLRVSDDRTVAPIADIEGAIAIATALESNRMTAAVIERLASARFGEESKMHKRVADHLDQLARLTSRRNDLAHQDIMEIVPDGLKPARVWVKRELLNRALLDGKDGGRKAVKAFINNNKPLPKEILAHAARLEDWVQKTRKLAKEITFALSAEVLMDLQKKSDHRHSTSSPT